MRRLLLAAAIPVALGLTAGTATAKTIGRTASAPRSAVYPLPGAVDFPEGIVLDRAHHTFYVSDTHTGGISRGQLGDPNSVTPFIPGPQVPGTILGVRIDHQDHLAAAGGFAGTITIYNRKTGARLRTFTTGATDAINDIAVAKNGDLYATDSFVPILWRVPARLLRSGTTAPAEAWLNLTGTAIVYTTGYNLNGIAPTRDGRYLIVTQSTTRKLYRIDLATKQVSEVDVNGEAVDGDGIQLVGHTLYAIDPRRAEIIKIAFSPDYAHGRVLSRTGDRTFAYPTGLALAGDRVLVVNSQFDKMFAHQPPVLPLTVSSVPIP